MKKLLLAIVATLSLMSCSSLPKKEVMISKTKDMKLPVAPKDEELLVYVIRPSSLGTFVRFNVFVNGKEDEKEVGWNRGNQYIHFFVKPGVHEIFSKAENWDQVEVKGKSGDVVYIKQTASMGIVMARNDIKEIPEHEGKYYLLDVSPGTIKKIKEKK